MKSFLLLLVVSVAFAACNKDAAPGGCPAICPAAANSLTPADIPNSGYTQGATTLTSVRCLNSVNYNSTYPGASSVSGPTGGTFGLMAAADFYWPVGVADSSKLFWIAVSHGGGGFAGAWFSTFGSGTGTYVFSPVSLIDYFADTPNPVGGKGVGIVEYEYPLSTASGTNTWPTQEAGVQCFRNWLFTKIQAGTVPGSNAMWGSWGPSWGGFISALFGMVPNDYYGTGSYGSCPVANQTIPPIRVAGSWPPLVQAAPAASSDYKNSWFPFGSGGGAAVCGAPCRTAIRQGLNCTDNGVDDTACAAADVSGQFSFWQLLTDSHAWVRAPQLWLFGGDVNSAGNVGDNTVITRWPGGGTLSKYVSAAQALTIPFTPQIAQYPGQAHEGDLTCGLTPPISVPCIPPSTLDAFTWLVGASNATTAAGLQFTVGGN